MTGLPVALLALAAVVLARAVGGLVSGRVSRVRVERFAARQRLRITAVNGPTVLRYLATTRRWRGGALTLAMVGYACVCAALRQAPEVTAVGVFAGWFVGAVVAEWRVDTLARGSRSAALLRARRLSDYVGPTSLAITGVVSTAGLGLALAAAAVSLARARDRTIAVLVLLGAVILTAVIIRTVRRVLERPQPLVTDELLAADNAIRGRSLNVLLGSALAIAGVLVAVSMERIAAPGGSDYSAATGLVLFAGYILLPALGVVTARTARPTPTGGPVAPGRDAT